MVALPCTLTTIAGVIASLEKKKKLPKNGNQNVSHLIIYEEDKSSPNPTPPGGLQKKKRTQKDKLFFPFTIQSIWIQSL